MAIMNINGVDFPAPVEYQLGIEPIWASAERNANGDMVGDILARKTKLACKWGVLTSAQANLIKNSVFPSFIQIRYLDTDGCQTKTFYSSPQTFQLLCVKDGECYWKDVSVNFIER